MTDMIATRDGYGEGLLLIGDDDRVVALDADLSESTRSSLFAKKYPHRFFQMGIAEQDMIGTAAGLAASGKIPFASTFAVFATGNAYSQIRLNAGISKLPIRIIGSHAGLMTGEDGASHQSLEDISLMRSIPGMAVIQPADAQEAKKAVQALVDYPGPAYLRLSRGKVPVLFGDDYEFKIGKAVEMKAHPRPSVAIFATGSMVSVAIQASIELEKTGISSSVHNIHTIKPLDEKALIKIASKAGAVVAVEDHSIIGGLGSAVAELLCSAMPLPLERVGVKDKFGQSGSPMELYEHYGLTVENVIKASKTAIRRKKK